MGSGFLTKDIGDLGGFIAPLYNALRIIELKKMGIFYQHLYR
jgi:hypothetical protein